ncbi:MAG TPA: beta-eliminating lyase-related protein [Nocardioidaceae bacterium]|nr:beta-eliminating lyase-related protein [Nocardioidaceae bacterium]
MTSDELEQRRKAARAACEVWLPFHGAPHSTTLLAALAEIEVEGEPDRYGEGGVVTELEQEVGELLGKPAAAFMPSGIMAQQAVLRAWADRSGVPRVAVHGLSHLVLHELMALTELHGIGMEHLTDEPRQPTPDDLAKLPGQLAAVTTELPLRDAGYLLPTWAELESFAAACREREIPLHLDGARIWESAPYLGHSLAEIAGLADSLYVSFYKGLGALAGAAVAGPIDVIDEARRWQRRHGGTLFTLLPYAVAAREGLHANLPRMTEYYETAVEVAKRLAAAGVRIVPDPPQTNAFRIFTEEPAHDVNERLLLHMETAHEAVAPWFRDSDAPGWSWTEFTVGSATCELGAEDVAERIAAQLVRTAP